LGEIKILRSSIDLVIIEQMIYSDIFGLKDFGLSQDGGDHVFGFFATLGQILPERGGKRVDDLLSVYEDVGVGTGSFFAQINYFFTADNKKGESQKEK